MGRSAPEERRQGPEAGSVIGPGDVLRPLAPEDGELRDAG